MIWQKIETDFWKDILKQFIKEHYKQTNSKTSAFIIENFKDEVNRFIQVCPKEMLNKIKNPITYKSTIKEVS